MNTRLRGFRGVARVSSLLLVILSSIVFVLVLFVCWHIKISIFSTENRMTLAFSVRLVGPAVDLLADPVAQLIEIKGSLVGEKIEVIKIIWWKRITIFVKGGMGIDYRRVAIVIWRRVAIVIWRRVSIVYRGVVVAWRIKGIIRGKSVREIIKLVEL
jgi:hypothetical protein